MHQEHAIGHVDDFDAVDFPGIATSERLEYDIDDINKDQQKKYIVKIASDFLDIANENLF